MSSRHWVGSRHYPLAWAPLRNNVGKSPGPASLLPRLVEEGRQFIGPLDGESPELVLVCAVGHPSHESWEHAAGSVSRALRAWAQVALSMPRCRPMDRPQHAQPQSPCSSVPSWHGRVPLPHICVQVRKRARNRPPPGPLLRMPPMWHGGFPEAVQAGGGRSSCSRRAAPRRRRRARNVAPEDESPQI